MPRSGLAHKIASRSNFCAKGIIRLKPLLCFSLLFSSLHFETNQLKYNLFIPCFGRNWFSSSFILFCDSFRVKFPPLFGVSLIYSEIDFSLIFILLPRFLPKEIPALIFLRFQFFPKLTSSWSSFFFCGSFRRKFPPCIRSLQFTVKLINFRFSFSAARRVNITFA